MPDIEWTVVLSSFTLSAVHDLTESSYLVSVPAGGFPAPYHTFLREELQNEFNSILYHCIRCDIKHSASATVYYT